MGPGSAEKCSGEITFERPCDIELQPIWLRVAGVECMVGPTRNIAIINEG